LISSPPDLQSLSAAEPWWHILINQGRDNSPPFYFAVLRGWREMVGSSDVAMRLLSVLCSVAAALMLYAVAATLYGRAAGLWAALLLSLATSQLELARQARPYAMLVALSVVSLLAIVRIETHGWRLRRGIILAMAMLAGLATHWLSLGFFVGIVAYVAIAWRGPQRRYSLGCLAVAVLLGAATLVPLEMFQIHHAARMTWWIQDREPYHRIRLFASLGDLPIRLFGAVYGPSRLYVAWWTMFLAAPILALRGRRDLLLATMTFYGTLLVPLTVDLLHNTLASTQTRYVIMAVAPMCLVIGGIFKSGVRGGAVFSHLLPLVIAIFSGVALFTFYSEPMYEDWRRLASMIVRESRPGEPIIFACPHHDDPEALPATAYLCASRYLPPGHPIYLADKPLTPADIQSLGTKEACIFTGWSFTMPNVLAPGSTAEEFRWLLPVGSVSRVRFSK
jgi:mannosyltransferase